MNRAKARRFVASPLAVASLYFVGSCVWIASSDWALRVLSADPNVIVFWSILKGFLYVAVTTGIVFLLMRRLSNATFRPFTP